MTTPGTPQDDVLSSSDHGKGNGADMSSAAASRPGTHGAAVPPQTIQQVLEDGLEPSEELLQELRALEEAPKLSDEELTQQALDAPGADGDPRTPE